jgi:hypothetical protein
MEMVLNNGFVELSMDDMCDIDGGGVWKAVKAFAGCVLVGFSPAIGIGVGIVAGPIAGVSAGGSCAGAGLSLIGSACH